MSTPQPVAAPKNPTLALARSWPRVGLALVLLLIPLVYFFPAVRGQVLLAPGDGWSQIFGIRVLIGQMLRAGQLPLWNPYIFGGMPLLASIQPGALYPPTWLFAVFTPKLAMNALVISTYHLALIGTYLFARRSGCNRLGALVAGLAFSFGGYMIGHLGHTNRVNAAAWLPWILLALEALHQQIRWRWIALGALFITLQLLAGEPQMTLYTVLTAGAYGLFTWLARTPRENRWRLLGAASAMAGGGVLLSMIQLLPEREFLAYGDRAAIDYDYFSQFSYPPQQLFELFFPYYFGGAALDPYRVPYWGQWNIVETSGYVGMAAWLLAFVALFSGRHPQRKLVWFWGGCALIALLLACGGNLPFGLNKILFQLPVYRLFRAPGRHLCEFTFAVGMLAGFGVTALATLERRVVRRALALATALLSLIVAAAVVVYLYFDEKLVTAIPLPPEAGALSNPDLYYPLIFFVLATAAAWLYGLGRTDFSLSRSSTETQAGQTKVRPTLSRLAGAALAVILLADALAWGISFEWRLPDFNLAEQLSDPPAVQFIKQREADWQSFRLLSHAAQPFDKQYRALNYPNVSIVRGLPSVNGYDPLRLARLAEITGRMTLDGVIAEPEAFNGEHRGFDLLNTKYLLREKPADAGERKLVERAGIQFAETPLNLTFTNGVAMNIATQAQATELAVISMLANSDALPNGAPVLRLKLHTADGRVIEREMQAGRDSAEWAYDRADVKARIQHSRAPVIESWTAGDFEGHRYLTRLSFDRAQIQRIELAHVPGDSEITLYQASLYDAPSNTATPLNQFTLAPDRWRKLGEFDTVELYENLHALPRAWFVNRWQALPNEQLLAAIKTGRLPDGASFNPRELALLAAEQYGARTARLPAIGTALETVATVTHYEPNRLTVETNNPQTGLLVLSEMYFRGWEARIDGQPTPIEQVNHVLRGLFVPAGAHRIEFVFRADSFRRGAWFSLAGVVFLLAGALVNRKIRRN